jgi:hypothetical protein
VPLSDIQEMGGWETPAMVQRYAHLSPAHLAHRAQLLDGLIDTNSGTAAELVICKFLMFGGQGRNRTTDTRIFSPYTGYSSD